MYNNIIKKINFYKTMIFFFCNFIKVLSESVSKALQLFCVDETAETALTTIKAQIQYMLTNFMKCLVQNS